MKIIPTGFAGTGIALATALLMGTAAQAQDKPGKLGFKDTPILPGGNWHVHDPDRPAPTVVTPAAQAGGAQAGGAPSDATILFDGKSLDAWRGERGPWTVEKGIMTIPPRSQSGGENNLISKQEFGDVQLHLEFRSPNPPTKSSQDRGNSGIWFMQRYEVQILDGYQNPTYADGTVGAVYAWKPPLVNPSRQPGEWQSYDIIFERPRFAADGSLVRPAYVTALLNGVLVQNHQAMLGTTKWRSIAQYQAHGDKAPIQLQDHDSPVSFRNIWVRPLPDEAIAQDLKGAGQ
ncbi:3-keto-disaccharide hydrolase [Sphingobium yanoikuyae]|uniref:3-keto-disaccharide hydrolase n=1 Tax=Sphingobium yanoikuyae TaxID=13690 RepID=UPI0035AE6B32